MSKIKELNAELKATLERVRDVAATAENEDRDFSDEERTQVTQGLKHVEDLKNDIKKLEGDAELRKSIESLGGEIVEGPSLEPVKDNGKKGSIGERFANHVTDSLKAFAGGVVSEKQDIRGIVSPYAVESKALITGAGATSGGALVFPQDLGLRDAGGLFQRELTVRDLVTNGQTSSDTVEFVRVTGFTNAAAPVAEATATAGASGLKPESALTLERVSTPVKTVAHWIPATKRALSDAGQIRTIVDNFLRYGLEEELEDQILLGNGSGENFDGIASTSNVQSQGFDTDIFVTARKALTKVRTVGKARPTAYVFSPEDDERIDLQRDGNDRFFGNGPFGVGPNTLWGIPRIVSEALDQGTAYVADWRQAVLWDREAASITVGTINDQLVRNMVTILAELRAAFGVIRPEAFVEIDTGGAGS